MQQHKTNKQKRVETFCFFSKCTIHLLIAQKKWLINNKYKHVKQQHLNNEKSQNKRIT